MASDSASYMPVAVRAWTGQRKEPKGGTGRMFQRLLVIDTETTTGPEQRLLFGFFRVADILRRRDGSINRLLTLKEGIIYADNLPATDPAGYATLTDYAKANPVLEIISRTEFARAYLKRAWRSNGAWCITGFNLPFDLSRLAYGWHESRSHDLAGSFSLDMFPYHDGKPNQFRPVLRIKHLDNKKSIIKWGGVKDPQTRRVTSSGQFLDLRQLIFGMTNRATSLAGACELFGLPGQYHKARAETYGRITPEFIGYARQDVKATEKLAETVLSEYERHPIGLQPTRVYSPASIGKAYLRSMGITPYLDRDNVPANPVMLGNCTSAFYGGRAEAKIRCTPVPVTVCDFTNMYGTVNVLMRLWDYQTASAIEADTTDAELQRFRRYLALVASGGTGPLLDQGAWPEFTGFACVKPSGDILPVRARYGGTDFNVGLNCLTSAEPLWYTYPDVIASALLTGKVPEVTGVIRFRPGNDQLSTLRPVKFLGYFSIDPAKQDLFRWMVEKRAELKQAAKTGQRTHTRLNINQMTDELKVLVNAPSYGINVEMTRDDKASAGEIPVYGAYPEPWETKPSAIEVAGEFCYPPVGAVITGAARLVLAIVERLVTDQGGSWLFCDTDSMAIVTNADGSLVPCNGGNHAMPDGSEAVKALSRAQVQEIRNTMERLNPYGKGKNELLKDETADANAHGQVYGYAVSAKRYCLFTYDSDGKPVIPPDKYRDGQWSGPAEIDGKPAYTQHGLGLYLHPANPASPGDGSWIRQAWQWTVDRAHGIESPYPEWSDIPALARYGVRSAHIMRAFRDWNTGRTYDESVKPFGFVLMASEQISPVLTDDELERKQDSMPKRLLAPYDRDPRQWLDNEWYELHKPGRPAVKITTDGGNRNGKVLVKDHRRVLDDYASHPEVKSAMPDGNPCNREYRGLLNRRVIHAAGIVHIGKESNRLDDVEAGAIVDPDDVYTTYPRNDRDTVLAVFSGMSNREVARTVAEHTRQRYQRAADRQAKSMGKRRKPESADTLMTRYRAYKPEFEEWFKWYGTASPVDDKMIGRYRNGRRIYDLWHERLIKWTAAELIAGSIGINPELINYTGLKSCVSPERALAIWRASN
jgi:hypothetical protein